MDRSVEKIIADLESLRVHLDNRKTDNNKIDRAVEFIKAKAGPYLLPRQSNFEGQTEFNTMEAFYRALAEAFKPDAPAGIYGLAGFTAAPMVDDETA